MPPENLKKRSDIQWYIEPHGKMNVPVIVFADRKIIEAMDQKVWNQAMNVAALPGIVKASYVMPDAHCGYGFPIGGVAAFDPEKGGIVSAGGVGFDISCGVRTITTGLTIEQIEPARKTLAELLARKIPAGVGSKGKINLNKKEMDNMLTGGARWAVEKGYGTLQDLSHIEENGTSSGADPTCVSDYAKQRQQKQVGTLGSGNHYMEIQIIDEVYDSDIAETFGLYKDQVVISIHCGSRGLGHQIGTDYLKIMTNAARSYNLEIPERELASAPLNSSVGKDYLAAMRAGINCALANRQVLTHLLRQTFAEVFPDAQLKLLYDVSHNTCKQETHTVNGKQKRLFVHRKGATRAFGPGHPDLRPPFRATGQPVIIGGSMGTASYILVGTKEGMSLAFGSSCHGAGRCMSRHQAKRNWQGKDVVNSLRNKGILVRSPSFRGVAEEAPGAYKDVTRVVDAAHKANLSKKIAKLLPIVCIKG
ncbi:MAG: RtcB family protein [Planctomycetota bacterium]|jgi:tRNA-splicing ligase RtcB